MKKGYSHITVVIDSSGSMESIKADTIGGYNAFLRKQKEVPGEATLTRIEFSSGNREYQKKTEYTPHYSHYNHITAQISPLNTHVAQRNWDFYQVVEHFVPVSAARYLTDGGFVPYGNTPLLDTVGRAIEETGRYLASMREEDRPEKNLFVIITDGEENASKTFSYANVSGMIELQTSKYSWEFMYIGANQDAIKEGCKLGIRAGSSVSYGMSAAAVGGTYDLLSNKAALFRSASIGSAAYNSAVNFTEEERIVAMHGEDAAPTLNVSTTQTVTL